LAVLAGVLITQFAWIWATPPFRGIDEIDHVFRAASVALGDVRPTRLPVDGRGALQEVPPGLAADARAQCEALSYTGRSNCNPEETLPNGNVLIASSAAGYSPVFYEVIGTIAKPWDGVTALYVMRGVASLINALFLSLAAWCLMTRSRTNWPIAGLLIGLTPMATYTSMLPAPNGTELAAAAALWCALLGLQGAELKSHGHLWAATALTGATLGCIRPTGPVFILSIVACVTLLAPQRTWRIVCRRWKMALGAAIVTFAATLYQVHWTFTHPPVSSGIDDRTPFNVGLILEQVVLWVFQWIGAFPYRNQPASPVTYVACGTLILVVFTVGLRSGDGKRWAALGVVAACLILPLIYTLVTFTELGTFWQGRYALPLLVGAPLLIGLALDRPDQESRVMSQIVPLFGLLSTSAAVSHVVHLEDQRPASLDDPHWHAPAAIAVVFLAAAAAVAFRCARTWARSGPSDATPAPRWLRRTVSPGRERRRAAGGEGNARMEGSHNGEVTTPPLMMVAWWLVTQLPRRRRPVTPNSDTAAR
jgi:hypothetical protein